MTPTRQDEGTAHYFTVTLRGVPTGKKGAVIKVVRQAIGLDLEEAKDFGEGLPAIFRGASREGSEALLKGFEELGAGCSVEPGTEEPAASPRDGLSALIGRIDGILQVIHLHEQSTDSSVPAPPKAWRDSRRGP